MPGSTDAYLYSPLFAQLVWLLALLPWPLFLSLWMATMSAAFIWLLKPLGWKWAVPLLLFCSSEVELGNITALIAIGIVLAVARPGWLALPALTKITPAVLGSVWFLFRGQWRQLAIAAIWTGALTAVSVITWPSAWHEWVNFLNSQSHGSTVLPRTVVAAVFVAVAAHRNWPWALAVGAAVATPVIAGSQVLMLLAAVPRLLQTRAPQSQPESLAGARVPERRKRLTGFSAAGLHAPVDAGTDAGPR